MLFASNTPHDLTPEDLEASGWVLLESGRWTHDSFTLCGRRRLFTEASALTLLAASQNTMGVRDESEAEAT